MILYGHIADHHYVWAPSYIISGILITAVNVTNWHIYGIYLILQLLLYGAVGIDASIATISSSLIQLVWNLDSAVNIIVINIVLDNFFWFVVLQNNKFNFYKFIWDFM
jgi:hypothetical protein